MELRQLRYFVAVAREGSFSAASARIGVAQPALSAQIAKLEQEVGRALLSRHARGANLTEAGRHFLDQAIDILDRVAQARDSMRTLRSPDPVEITLGVPPLISMMMTVPLVEMVARDLPTVSLKVIEGMSGALRGWLADCSIDLAFLHNVDAQEFPGALPVIRESLYVAVSVDGPIRFGAELHARDLVRLPLIASTARNSHRQLLEALGRRYNTPLTIAAEVDSIPRQCELVRRGIGALVMPLAGFSEWPRAEFRLARLVGEGIAWETSLVAATSRAGAAAMAILAPPIEALARDLMRAGRWPGVAA